MSTAVANIEKSHMGFRFRNDLANLIRAEARKENRSLNNYMENLLVQYFSANRKIPNATTLAAMREVESDKELDTLDLDNFEEYIASL